MNTPPPPAHDWDKLARYLAGESSPSEANEVRRWLEEHPAEAELIAELDRATRGLVASHAPDVEAALRTVKARPASAGKAAARFSDYTRRIEMVAGAAAIILVAGVFLLRRNGPAPAPAPEVGYATGIGQRDSVRLDDGSMVILGPLTRIAVRGRDVELRGEAYFRVAHDAARPFTVRAGTAIIRDIGTEFSVHSDGGAGEPVRVVVREGAVHVTNQGDSATLRAGDVGVVTEGGAVEARRNAATADDLAWTRGRLLFRDASMGELAADLRRWYGVELRVSDSALARKHFTGSFVTETPDRVLEAIALALGARVQRRADTAYITPAAAPK
jgi:transmembrane sensor